MIPWYVEDAIDNKDCIACSSRHKLVSIEPCLSCETNESDKNYHNNFNPDSIDEIINNFSDWSE